MKKRALIIFILIILVISCSPKRDSEQADASNDPTKQATQGSSKTVPDTLTEAKTLSIEFCMLFHKKEIRDGVERTLKNNACYTYKNDLSELSWEGDNFKAIGKTSKQEEGKTLNIEQSLTGSIKEGKISIDYSKMTKGDESYDYSQETVMIIKDFPFDQETLTSKVNKESVKDYVIVLKELTEKNDPDWLFDHYSAHKFNIVDWSSGSLTISFS